MFSLSKLEWLALTAALLLCPGGFPWGAEPQADAGAAGSGASAAAPSISLFDRLDRNKDGYLSREELDGPEARNRNWIAVDRDRDGRISRSEFSLIAVPSAPQQQPSAAAGASPAPKKE